MLRVQLLGVVTAFRDGRPVPLSAQHRRLLAFLALHPVPHERDALAARFWPDAPDPRANLRTAVWVLRRSLGDDAVVATRTSVALGPVTRDLDETEAIECDEPGPPCAGMDDDWAEAARAEHLRRRIERLDGVAAATDDPAEAARWSARRCAMTPLDEPAHRALVERLVAAGDRAGGAPHTRDRRLGTGGAFCPAAGSVSLITAPRAAHGHRLGTADGAGARSRFPADDHGTGRTNVPTRGVLRRCGPPCTR